MRAWTYTSRGLPSEVLTLRDDLAQPSATTLAPNEALIKVCYAGIFQSWSLMMQLVPHFNNKPWIPDMDFSGVVAGVGADVTHLKVGDACFGGQNPATNFKYGGVVAEYIVCPADLVVKKPENISLQDAAGLACCGCTAMGFLDVLKLKEGDRVLVTAASSGTGVMIVQAVKAVVGKSGSVIGTCSSANSELVRNLGVDETIDYRLNPELSILLEQKYHSRPLDCIIDVAGSDPKLYQRCPPYLAPDGTFMYAGKMAVSHGTSKSPFGPLYSTFQILHWLITFQIGCITPVFLGGVPRRALFHSGRVEKRRLERLRDMVDKGQIRGVVDSVWEMEDCVKAYDRVATSRARGKVLVHVQD